METSNITMLGIRDKGAFLLALYFSADETATQSVMGNG